MWDQPQEEVVVSERSCARARRALSLVLDYEADASDLERLTSHLGRCGRCRAYTAEVASFTRQLRLLRGVAIGREQERS